MSRDHRKLNVFSQADELVVMVSAETATFPFDERFGLRTQVRRAAVSVPANIVEGCARRKEGEYLQFVISRRVQQRKVLVKGLKRLQSSLEGQE
jgi:hypothetical protein